MEKYTNLMNNILPVQVYHLRRLLPGRGTPGYQPSQNSIHSCACHGDKMSTHDKQMALESWRNDQVQVSPRVRYIHPNVNICPSKWPGYVCTSALGMGIDQSNIDKVIRVGVPPSIEHLVQEFGQAGRDGRTCVGIVFYHDSDLQHAAF